MKFFLRQVTGKHEIERICEQKASSYEITTQLSRCFHESDKLHTIFPLLRSVDVDIDQMASTILEIKHVPTDKQNVHACVRTWLQAEKGIMHLMKELEELSKIQYSSDNPSHERQLESLWTLLKPGVSKPERITDKWQDIGFQGKDPATDFRGMGILGLQNLVYFARTYPEKARSLVEKDKYSFAIVGINISSHLLDLCRKGKFNIFFFKHGHRVDQFHELYSRVSIEFSVFYENANPSSIMDYPLVMKKFLTVIPQQICNTK